MVLHLDNVSWAVGKMWAPDAVYWHGCYYLVFCALQARPQHEPIFRTGLAVADTPAGPFTDIGFIHGVDWYACWVHARHHVRVQGPGPLPVCRR